MLHGKTGCMKAILSVFISSLLFTSVVVSINATVVDRAAVGHIDNADNEPRFAYLSPIIEGLLLYDLSEKGGISVVERSKLDKVVAEQELQLGGLTTSTGALKIGQLANARWLIYGQYSILDGEVLLTVQLTDVNNGETTAIRERDATEHVVHHAAEVLIQKLSGRSVILADASNARSILSLRDEKPGSIAVYSRINNAKIYIDHEFSGFTKGKEQEAIEFNNIPPGQHIVQTVLDRTFGVLELPDGKFHPWEVITEVKPGRRAAVLDETLQVYDAIQKASLLNLGTISIPLSQIETFTLDKSGDWTDIEKKTRHWSIRYTPASAPESTMNFTFNIGNGTVKTLTEPITVPLNTGNRTDKDLNGDMLSLSFSLIRRSEKYEMHWELTRNDLDPERFVYEPVTTNTPIKH